LIDFQIPAKVQKECVYIIYVCTKHLHLDSDMGEDTWKGPQLNHFGPPMVRASCKELLSCLKIVHSYVYDVCISYV
jgi:hypothetical protein